MMKNATDEFKELLNWLGDQSLLSKELIDQIDEPYAKNEEEKWRRVRGSFFPNNSVRFFVEPMNSANLCPTFYPALELVSSYRNQFNRDISMQFRRELFKRVLSAVRDVTARHIGGDKENIAFMRNTSEANNQLSRGFNNWGENEVLLWDENHPTNRHVWKSRSPRKNQVVEFSLKGVDFNQRDEDKILSEILEKILEKVTAKTVILSFSEVSNVSGIRMPTAEIIKAVRAYIKAEFNRDENSIHIHVDGAVSWGALKIDVKETDCDSFSSSSHKWLMGPFETGILYMKSEKAKNFDISIHGYNGNIDFIEEVPENTSRFEFLGQRDEANLIGMGRAVSEHLTLGREDIENRVKDLQKYLRDKLDAMVRELSLRVVYSTPVSRRFSNGVTVMQFLKRDGSPFNHPQLNAFLYGASSLGRFAVADTGMGVGKTNELRICPHIMNLEGNIDAVVGKIKAYLVSVLNEDETSSILVDESSSMNWPNNPYGTKMD